MRREVKKEEKNNIKQQTRSNNKHMNKLMEQVYWSVISYRILLSLTLVQISLQYSLANRFPIPLTSFCFFFFLFRSLLKIRRKMEKKKNLFCFAISRFHTFNPDDRRFRTTTKIFACPFSSLSVSHCAHNSFHKS